MSIQPGNLVIDQATEGERYDQKFEDACGAPADPKRQDAIQLDAICTAPEKDEVLPSTLKNGDFISSPGQNSIRDSAPNGKLITGNHLKQSDSAKAAATGNRPKTCPQDSSNAVPTGLEASNRKAIDDDSASIANKLLFGLIGEDRFDMWFTGEHSLMVEDNFVVVKASNEFTLESIKANYTGELKQVVEKGQFAGLTFQCVQQLKMVLNSKAPTSSNDNLNRQIDLFDVGRVSKSPKRKTTRKKPSGLLAEFVVDPENEMVWRACQQALATPGEWSPLFLSGNSGTGKTHLLEGLCSEARRRSRTGKVMFISAENFTSDYVGSLTARAMPMFRKRYRELDFFLIDDIHFLDGKKSTLDELQHTIEAIGKRGGQVVISADRSPSELEFATPEFINRVACGLACEIALPSESTKRKIIKRISKLRGLKIKNSVLDYIAANVSGDVRLLSGALNRIKAFQIVKGETISLEEAKLQLKDLVGASRKSVSIPEIEKAVCDMFGLEKNSLRSASKVKAISQPRMLAMWLSRKYTRAALSEIGEHFGGRSHSTVISAKSKVEKWVECDDSIGIRHSEFSVTTAIRRIEHELRVG